tara:strand:+ start:4672 stop:5349 length:678 start_codon:yes stop_codon:yes gene_type:complete
MKKLMFAILRVIGRKWVLDYTNELLTRPTNGNNLELAFLDDKGRAYYRYPDGLMPVIRMGAIQTYTSYLAVALTPDLIDKAFEDVKAHLAHGDTLKAGAVLTSLQEFQRSCVNIDAFLNILAAKYVREDEDPSGQDARIHQEKLDFLESKINDTAFFFKLSEWKALLNRYEISMQDAEKLHNDYRNKRKQHENRMSVMNGTRFDKKSEATHSHSESSSDTSRVMK